MPAPKARTFLPPGVASGALGIVAFSGSLPFTRLALRGLDPVFVSQGRAVLAALFAAVSLWWFDRRIPERRAWIPLIVVALCVVIGFPLLSAIALTQIPAGHGSAIVAIAPLATATLGVLRGREQVPKRFWAASVVGAGAVIVYAVHYGGGRIVPADALILVSVVIVAVGYAEGGFLARTIGGFRTICWALLVAAPFLALGVPLYEQFHGWPRHAGLDAWIGFAYVSCFSMFLGFVAWYRGLGRGGVARVGQLQLLQAPGSFLWSAFMLDEPITRDMLLVVAVVIGCVLVSQKARAPARAEVTPTD
jgi:drug/metabolite transporter (DMT)-like permease